MKTNLSYKLLALLIFVCIGFNAAAQETFGEFNGDVPIDGGLSLLVAAGVGYGAKKLRQKRNSEK